MQVAAERGGYGGERYEKLEFQKEVEQKFKALKDSTWQVQTNFQLYSSSELSIGSYQPAPSWPILCHLLELSSQLNINFGRELVVLQTISSIFGKFLLHAWR